MIPHMEQSNELRQIKSFISLPFLDLYLLTAYFLRKIDIKEDKILGSYKSSYVTMFYASPDGAYVALQNLQLDLTVRRVKDGNR